MSLVKRTWDRRGGSERNGASAPLPLSTALIVGAGLAVGAVAVLFLYHVQVGPVDDLLRDPAAIYDFSPLVGLFSNLGVFAMFCAGAICLFASPHALRDRGLLRAIGLLTLFIALDDFFMLHEYVVRRVLGIREVFVLALLALVTAAIFLTYWREVVGWNHLALGLALGLLASSVALDQTGLVISRLVPGLMDLLRRFGTILAVLEDVSKFAGIGLWALYWIRRAGAALRP